MPNATPDPRTTLGLLQREMDRIAAAFAPQNQVGCDCPKFATNARSCAWEGWMHAHFEGERPPDCSCACHKITAQAADA